MGLALRPIKARGRTIHTYGPYWGPHSTSARTLTEAQIVAQALTKATGKHWVISDGPQDWHTGKPNCYIIQEEA